MNVNEFFLANRDEHGRAWVNAHCWVEQSAGCFRLNTPVGMVSFLGSADMRDAEAIAARSGGVDEAADEAVSADVDSEASCAVRAETEGDQFDDFHGGSAWPGLSADDAESGDSEDSLGDMAEGDEEDWDDSEQQ